MGTFLFEIKENRNIDTPIPVGITPIGIAYDSDNKRMYVTNIPIIMSQS
jgi:DNA-binding beta-propeller fold protein YncE